MNQKTTQPPASKKDKKEWARYRNRLLDETASMKELFHKTVIALSGGALALSITFLGNVFEPKSIAFPDALFWSWICLTSSLIVAIVQLMLEIYMRRHMINKITQGQLQEIEEHKGFMLFLNRIRYIPFHFLGLLAGFVLMGMFLHANIQ